MNTAQMQALIAAFPEAAVIVDGGFRVRAANAPATALAGALATGDSLLSRWRHPAIIEAVEAALAGQPVAARQVALVDAGREVALEVSATALPPNLAVVVLSDRSHSVTTARIRSDFVANASHELKSPLTAVLGAIETLRGPAAADDAARGRFLDVMEREARRMAQLIDDLMSLNRVEAQERERPLGTVVPADIAAQVVTDLAPLARERGATVSTDIRTRAAVQGDAAQLAQALRNLVDNALRHGGDPAQVAVSVEDRTPDAFGRNIALSVCDNGPGIAPAHVPRLTERFYRVDGHRSRALGGTGLGLAIVKHVVGRHRGRLDVTTKPGEGACFTIWLPSAPRG